MAETAGERTISLATGRTRARRNDTAQHPSCAQRKKRGRKPKADNLPIREAIHELSAADRACSCCGKDRPEIGEERSAEYDLVAAHVVKIVHVQKQYGPCSFEAFRSAGKTEVIAAPGPVKIVRGSDFTNRTIAFFLTAKYQNAIPFYRSDALLI